MHPRRLLTGIVVLTLGLGLAGAAWAQGVLMTEADLGALLYSDATLSLYGNQSCATCHTLAPGFVDPENVDFGTPNSLGSDGFSRGGRNTPSSGYAAFSPFFRWDDVAGLYVGGQFWDGRANTLAEQAAGPFRNPVEMAMPDKWSVVSQLKQSATYQDAFLALFDIDLGPITTYPVVFPLADGVTPPPALPPEPGVLEAYDAMAKAIGEFEKTRTFNQFTSKYDAFLAGQVRLTPQEQKGLKLFEGKGKCALCHLSQPSLAPDGGLLPPLFTDFTYDNLGVPVNPLIGPGPDLGLGGRADIAANDPLGLQLGKFKVMSLRNIALTAPYGHNGFFAVFDDPPVNTIFNPAASLAQIVHFYNTRDVLAVCVDPLGATDVIGVTCWPAPEVALNVNAAELGALRLSAAQEADIVAFLLTLTDGFVATSPYPFAAWPPIPMP